MLLGLSVRWPTEFLSVPIKLVWIGLLFLVGRIGTDLDFLLFTKKLLFLNTSILKDVYWSNNVSSHIWVWDLDHKESWAQKNWCFQTVLSEKALESPLNGKIKPVNSKENQPWIIIGKTDAEVKLRNFGHLMRKTDSLEKTDAGKDWGQEEKGTTEDEMVGWNHRLDGQEFE